MFHVKHIYDMKKIFQDTDLGIPYTNRVNRFVVDSAKSLLGINRINTLYNAAYTDDGVSFAARAIRELAINCQVTKGGLDNIPASGPFIVIANHPHGALDGLLLADIVVRRRPDTKFLGNFLLEKVEPMRNMVLQVNPFDNKAGKNVSGIRAAQNHLKQGGGLIIFPAGEVSTYYNGFSICEDKEWSASIMKFIKGMQVEVLPIHISGSNSRKFHIIGKLHPMLRTVRLPLELLNKTNKKISVNIGTTISIKRQGQLNTIEQYRDYLRANVYYMMGSELEPKKKKSKKIAPVAAPVAAPPKDLKTVIAEINALPKHCRLFAVGVYDVLYCDSQLIPNTFKEVCRLRELTFRMIGEGTNMAEDKDDYDSYYQHLIIWHNEQKCIVGAYRVGMGKDILAKRGIEGFYTNSLFEYSSKFADILGRSIELGRSFVVPEFQKQTKPLMLLWQGILMILLRNPEYQYLLGPVSVSSNYSTKAKRLIINYFKGHRWNAELAKMVIPRNGTKELGSVKVNTSLLKNIDDINLIDKLIIDLDYDKTPLPVLLRKYLQLGSTVLGFNIDPNFNDSLDVLTLLDVKLVPSSTLDLLSKQLGVDVREVERLKGRG